jgi:Flp pilus assembly protein TadG
MRLRIASGRRGQTLVEFALLLPVFLLLLLGILDGGRAVYAYSTIANAARHAARVAIVNQDPPTVELAAVDQAVGLGLHWDAGTGDSNDVDFTITTCTGSSDPCAVSVVVSYDFEPVTPFLGEIFSPFLTSTAEMPVERVNP